MLKIPKRYSLTLSAVLSVLFFALCILGAIFLPHITNTLIALKERVPDGGASTVLAFAAVFLGICLRVVKNVLEEGAEIKSENDLTV